MFAGPSLASWCAGELSDHRITAKCLGGAPQVERFLVQQHGATVGFVHLHPADDGGGVRRVDAQPPNTSEAWSSS